MVVLITILQRDCYSKDGECYRYISGEMHYFRIPPQYWMDRLRKLRAAGFDTVQTYDKVFKSGTEQILYDHAFYRFLSLSSLFISLTVSQ